MMKMVIFGLQTFHIEDQLLITNFMGKASKLDRMVIPSKVFIKITKKFQESCDGEKITTSTNIKETLMMKEISRAKVKYRFNCRKIMVKK